MEIKNEITNEYLLEMEPGDQENGIDGDEKEFLEAVKNYKSPKMPEIVEKLEWFKDQKFGLMVHWGLYNQLGIKESWPLTDYPWTKWQFAPGTPLRKVKELYAQLHKGFLPLRFDPEEWAEIACDAGFKYLCFTTKHHDGFCMWDTKTTEYKVTGKDVPWRGNENGDITRALFDAFRKRGMGISLYYSRADFSTPYYWEEGYGMQDGTERPPSYNPEEKPEKWRKFQEYVFTQLKELVNNYGKIDALWFDGGCDGKKLGIPEMMVELRKIQPDMLGVLRGEHGVCEDILTPELFVPQKHLELPWEVCTVMGKPIEEYGHSDYISFGYTYDQDYMSAKEVAHMLLDVVAKGGNLALNIAPQPDGRLPGRAIKELRTFAKWMKVFSSAIYETRTIAPYRRDKYAYTIAKDKKRINVFYMYDDGEIVPEKHDVLLNVRAKRIWDLRSGKELEFTQNEKEICVKIPETIKGFQGDIADCIVVEF